MDARVAASGAGGTFHVDVDGTNATGSLTIPDTGGWQAWTTVSSSMTLPAGMHIVRVSFDAVGPSGVIGNLNYLRFSPSDRPVSTPFGGTAWTIPGTIQAEDFDDGGEGMAYHDASAGNDGGQYRSSDVDIEATATTAADTTLAGLRPANCSPTRSTSRAVARSISTRGLQRPALAVPSTLTVDGTNATGL